MINIAEILVTTFAKALDYLKFNKPRYWALVGALIIAIEQLLLSGTLPFADKIPTLVVEVFIGLSAILLNTSSSTIPKVTINSDGSIGSLIDSLLAGLVEKLKAGNLTVFNIMQILFVSIKFYIISDTTLNLPALVLNGVISLAMLFTIPRTKPVLAKMGVLPALKEAA